jgi:MFS transporter, SP family, solute carrier family 2 (myo-inositol transporter), member 13
LISLACIGGFLFGYDTGIISGALVLISDDFELNNWQEELIVATTVFGAMISSMASGSLCDQFGRKPIVLTSAVVFVIGSILMACANSYHLLVVGRFVVGLGVGAASMNMPVIISEMAETSQRGTLVTCVNVSITGGQFISCLVAGSLSTVPEGWRYMLGIAALPALIQFFGFLYMPESPRWLIENDQIEKAIEVLQRLRGFEDVYEELEDIIAAVEQERGHNTTTNAIGGEYRIDQQQSQQKLSLWEHLSSPYIRRALFIGCCLQAGQQLGGINTVMYVSHFSLLPVSSSPRYYSATILKLAGFTSTSQAIWLSSVVAFCNFFGSCVGLYFVDRMGRRALTIYSQISTVLCLACLSLCFYLAQQTSPHLMTSHGGDCSSYHYCFDCVQDDGCGYCSSAQYLPSSYHSASSDGSRICMKAIGGNNQNPVNETICSPSDFYPESCPDSQLVGWMIFMVLCLYLLGFAPGMGPMPWCINSEIYPTAFRGIGNSIATTVNWSTNILMSMTFLTIIDAFTKQGAFLLYAFISLLFLLIFLFYLPETKQIPLEQIRTLFQDDVWGKHCCGHPSSYQLLPEERSQPNSSSPSPHFPPSTPAEDFESHRESNGTNEDSVNGPGGGSQQSKLSYQISYNGNFLPPVDLFQSDSSSHSATTASAVSSRPLSQPSGEIIVQHTSIDPSQEGELGNESVVLL